MPTSSAESRPEPRLVVAEVSAGYGGAPIVQGISLSVGAGEKVAIVGPNGAGKSTVLKAIMGELSVLGGTITLDDGDVTRMRGERLAALGIGYVPQVRDVFDTLTVAENLDMGGYRLARAELQTRVAEVIAFFPALGEMLDRVAGRLSGGQRKMLAIARTLMLRPRLLILDEPSANLAPDLAHRVLHEYVGRLADTGVAILLVEQRVREALEICDWGYVLVAGANRLEGPAGELLERADLADIFLGAEADDHEDPIAAGESG